jgi:hypothetical protein
MRSHLDDLGRSIDDYLEALGSFVMGFSEVEAAIQNALWTLAGVKPPTAQAVFSGVRTEDAMNRINRIAAAQNWPKQQKTPFEAVFSQLRKINKLRNDILHHGSTIRGIDHWEVSNEPFVHLKENIRTRRLSPAILRDAKADLDVILSRLILLVWRDRIPADSIEDFSEALKTAWRYKPDEQRPPSQKPRSTPPKQKRQPKPSRASRRKAAMKKHGKP